MSSIYTSNLPYCVYLTIYSGNKLPMFYIGSSSVANIKNGYHGSVSSKVYKSTWKKELKENPQLFKTKIISYYTDRKLATISENKLHKSLNVVKSSLYINKSNAIPDGAFGNQRFGENNTFYNKKHTIETKNKIGMKNKGRIKTESCKIKWRLKNIGKKRTKETCSKISNALKGKPRPQSARDKLSKNYILTSPLGETLHIKNLTEFCRQNNLHRGNLICVAKGKYKTSKGWKCEYA